MLSEENIRTDYFNYRRALWWLILISLAVRAFLAANFRLGNDEVYYWLLAANPAPTYFDHPPMFAWFINLFSGGLFFDSELFVRFSSIVVFSFNTWLVFQIGTLLKNERGGFIAALLYQSSIYTFVITGIMILPDTPLSLFWLLSMYFFMQALRNPQAGSKEQRYMLLAGLVTGLAIISKYHAILLWGGAGGFILFHRRIWFRKPQLYMAAAITALIIAPVLLAGNENVSFQTDRVALFGEIKPLFLMREFFGQLIYNNPLNVLLAFVAVFSFRKRKYLAGEDYILLLWFGLPALLIFLFFALFSATLPHWSAPGYYALMFLAAACIADKKTRILPVPNRVATGLLAIGLLLAYGQINYGFLDEHDRPSGVNELGKDDVTLDLYGWDQIAAGFVQKALPVHPETKTIIAHKWYNAAHLDYYLVRPVNKKAGKVSIKLIALGSPLDIHEYMRINKERGGLQKGDNAWFLAISRSFYDPRDLYKNDFERISAVDTLPVVRGGNTVEYVVVFYLENCTDNIVAELPN
jgi:hypothetical protein